MLRQNWKAALIDYAFVNEQPTDLYCIKISAQTLAVLLPLVDYLGWKTRYYNAPENIDQDVIETWRDNAASQLMNEVECGDMTDYCCPETNDLLREIIALMRAGGTFRFEGGAVAIQPIPDCSPDKFDGNTGQTEPEAILRLKALCLATRRLVSRITYSEFIKLGIKSRDVGVLINQLEPLPIDSFESWQGTQVSGLVSGDYVLLQSSSVAFEFAVCCLFEHWLTLSLTIENFKAGMSDCPPVLIPLTTEDRYAKIIPYYLGVDKNFAVFATELERAYDDVVANPDEYTSNCGCGDVVLPCGFTIADVTINSGNHYPPGSAEFIGDNTWRFTPTLTDTPSGYADIRAIHIVSATGCNELVSMTVNPAPDSSLNLTDHGWVNCEDGEFGTIVPDGACFKNFWISYGATTGNPAHSHYTVDVKFGECCE